MPSVGTTNCLKMAVGSGVVPGQVRCVVCTGERDHEIEIIEPHRGVALLGLFPSAGHALSFGFSFTGSCSVAPTCTVTGEIDGLSNGTSAATAVIIDSISNAAFKLPAPLPFNTFCGSKCLVPDPNSFTVAGGVLTAEDFVASSNVIITDSPPFEGDWSLVLGAFGPKEMSLSNGSTPPSCAQPCADFQDNILSQSGATFTPLSGGATPIPAALPLFATGLGALGLFGWRRKRKNTAALVGLSEVTS